MHGSSFPKASSPFFSACPFLAPFLLAGRPSLNRQPCRWISPCKRPCLLPFRSRAQARPERRANEAAAALAPCSEARRQMPRTPSAHSMQSAAHGLLLGQYAALHHALKPGAHRSARTALLRRPPPASVPVRTRAVVAYAVRIPAAAFAKLRPANPAGTHRARILHPSAARAFHQSHVLASFVPAPFFVSKGVRAGIIRRPAPFYACPAQNTLCRRKNLPAQNSSAAKTTAHCPRSMALPRKNLLLSLAE